MKLHRLLPAAALTAGLALTAGAQPPKEPAKDPAPAAAPPVSTSPDTKADIEKAIEALRAN